MAVVCDWCGATFDRPQTSKRRFCSRHCGAMWRVSAGFSKGRVKDPAKYGTRICPVCKKEFDHLLSRPERQCCSHSCAAKLKAMEGRHGRHVHGRDEWRYATTACPACGKVFEYQLSWPRKYCSRACAGKANVRNIKKWAPTGYDATCEICGKEFHADSTRRGRFCSLQCFGKWQSQYVRGLMHPLTGHKFGRNVQRFGLPTMQTCIQCGAQYVIKPSMLGESRFCSKKCLGAYQSVVYRGEGNPSWEGGYEPYYGPSWSEARRLCRARDLVCQRCGKAPEQLGKQLDVHHIQPFRTFGRDRHEEANALSNLVALCQSCHLAWEWAAKGRRGTPRRLP